jgi:hypothetical protein
MTPISMDANATVRYAGGRSRAGRTRGKGTRDNNAGPAGECQKPNLSCPIQTVVVDP